MGPAGWTSRHRSPTHASATSSRRSLPTPPDPGTQPQGRSGADPRHARLVGPPEGNLLRQSGIELRADPDREALSLVAARLTSELRGLDAGGIASLAGVPGPDAAAGPPAGSTS